MKPHRPKGPEQQPHRPKGPERPQRQRFALGNLGGQTLVAGDPGLSELLAHALATDDEERDRLTHGFHSYPARMHWLTAQRVLEGMDIEGARVLDPFCGSGTVLVESRVRGLEAMGIDLNPLAVRLSRVKTQSFNAKEREHLAGLASELRELSEERVRAREDVRAQLPPTELRWYEPHVLKEMAGLLDSLKQVEEDRMREVLTMVFSSLVVKFSRQRSDTAEELVEKRIRKGLVSEFFERKTHELCERMGELEAAARPGPAPLVVEGDAHWLREHVERGGVDLVLTSPPYGGTYDYAAHHARRFAWLGMDTAHFQAREIGARRHGLSADRFAKEMHLTLRSIRSTLRNDGWLLMLMGDAQYGDQRVPADKLVEQLAEEGGFEPVAIASQARADYYGGADRYEHLMALRAV